MQSFATPLRILRSSGMPVPAQSIATAMVFRPKMRTTPQGFRRKASVARGQPRGSPRVAPALGNARRFRRAGSRRALGCRNACAWDQAHADVQRQGFCAVHRYRGREPSRCLSCLISGKPCQAWPSLLVEEIFSTRLIEIGKVRGPTRNDLLGRNAALKLPDGFCVADK
jgi:hypothetical protein